MLTAFAKGEATTVMTDDGENHKLSAAQSETLIDCNTEALDANIVDLVNISDLNEMSILHNLRIRFKCDNIYTRISSILISVNPFKMLPLYTAEKLDMYRNGSRGLPPHIYATAYNAYNSMLSDGGDQSMVISGESGAGKSEATKLILQFLADVSTRQNAAFGVATGSSSLENKLLAANPILEAFGNAKTLRNNNSSRFGKLITVNFDKNGCIIGGGIVNYLLEKSRVVFQTQGERNYHIFYQLLSIVDVDAQLTSKLKLQQPKLFDFTSQSGVDHVDGISDDKDFDDVKNSMSVLKFSPEEMQSVFTMVAGVLHFGNLKFKVVKNTTTEDAAEIVNTDTLAHACSLWGIDNSSDIQKLLTSKNIGTKEVVLVTYNVMQAQDARDAMVKRVYSELFQLLVDKINKELASEDKSRHKFIGVLDIFGFESFAVNSFEQLCINYCNEKLQFHFNEHIFKMEQTLYAAEGIVIPGTAFVDNQPTLDLLELKATGVFSLCDDEINVPRGSDETFLSKVLGKYADSKPPHPNLVRPKAKEVSDFLKNFGIVHYAGTVFYNVTNFLLKNKDELHPDIVASLRASRLPMMQAMMAEREVAVDLTAGDKAQAKRGSAVQRKVTLGGQFKTQLAELVSTLNNTYPHFVRCMKSNDEKKGNLFSSARMLEQLRYAGLVEVCRIRKLGFPVRRPFEEFYKRFKCCDIGCKDLDSLLQSLLDKAVLKEGEWARGHSRVFMRNQQSIELELERERAFTVVVKLVQKVARGYVMRTRLKAYKVLLREVERAIAGRELRSLTAAIEHAFELPFGGAHLPLVRAAKVLQARLKEEERVQALLQGAVAVRELNGLRIAIATAEAMDPPFQPPLLLEARAVVARLEAEIECKAGLVAAMAARCLQQLAHFIAVADEMLYECAERQQAQALRARIDHENDLLEKVNSAAVERNLSLITSLISECFDYGISDRAEVLAAVGVKEEILVEIAEAEREAEEERQRLERELAIVKRNQLLGEAKEALLAAIESNEPETLNQALQEATRLGLPSDTPEVQAAEQHQLMLQSVQEVGSRISAAVRLLQFKAAAQGLVEEDLSPLQQAVDGARALESPLASQLVDEGVKATELYSRHAAAAVELELALASNERLRLKSALEAAENLEMRVPAVPLVREALRVAEEAFRSERASGSFDALVQKPYDEAEQARRMRREVAAQARFDHRNFPYLCTADDFAKGIIINKAKAKECFLSFQSSVIPRSLLELDKEFSRVAVQMHKNLLGYMGDKQLSFPAMLAHDILQKGFKYKEIRDEIYMQIIKQINLNPRPESVAKGWQMLCMCVGTFPPSYEFENFLLHYIMEKLAGRGAVADYAKYCLRTLEALLNNGDGSGFVLSVEEIWAYKERPPILATIYLVDGNVITEELPVTPDLNVGKVLEMCAGYLDLSDPRLSTLGMFVYDLGGTGEPGEGEAEQHEDLPRTPRPLRNDDYMGDVIVQRARIKRNFKFVVKKKTFHPQHNFRGTDSYFERLIYLQAEDETIIQGNIDIEDAELVVHLASISMAVAYGQELAGSAEGLVADNVLDFVVPKWRDKKSADEWAVAILPNRESLLASDLEDLQAQFVEIIQQSPLYGTHWFVVYKFEMDNYPEGVRDLPLELQLGFNDMGLSVYSMERELLLFYPYAVINRWGGTTDQFSLVLSPSGEDVEDFFEFIVITGQAQDMAAVILDNIHMLMESLQTDDEAAAPPGQEGNEEEE